MKTIYVAALLAIGLLTIPVSTSPYLTLEEPFDGATVGRDFGVRGMALNADVVHIWAFPSTGAVFLGAAYTNQGDTIRRTDTGGVSFMVRGAPVGDYPVVFYAHDPSTGTFPTSMLVNLHVKACEMYNVGWTFTGPGGWVGPVVLPFCAPMGS